MKPIEKIIAFIRENGPEFGPDLCRALKLDVGDMHNYTRAAVADGSLLVEKRLYPGTALHRNYFSLPVEGGAPVAAAPPTGPNPADPFGLVAKRKAASDKPVANEDPIEKPTAPAAPAPIGRGAEPGEDWRLRALAAEEQLAKVRAMLTAIGIVATENAALIAV